MNLQCSYNADDIGKKETYVEKNLLYCHLHKVHEKFMKYRHTGLNRFENNSRNVLVGCA